LLRLLRRASLLSLLFSFSWTRPPPTSPLFPYTTLFRSHGLRTDVRLSLRGQFTESPSKHMESVLPTRHQPASAPATVEQGQRFRSEEHTSELQSLRHLVCRLLLEKKKKHTLCHDVDDSQ